MSQAEPQYYIGIMSGTSLDAIDAVLIDFTSTPLKPIYSIIQTISSELPNHIRKEILALNTPCDNDLQRSLVLDKQIADLFSQVINELLFIANITANHIIAIGSHGQTLRHAPDGPRGYSLQIGNGHIIAERTQITTVSDFRSRDVAAGGQGAPLVPAFHHAIFQCEQYHRAIINIGGMANISILKSDTAVYAFDTGPGNVLLNYWCHKNKAQAFDANGDWARSGTVIPSLLNRMLQEAFFHKPAPKSTGRELFDQHWLSQFDVSLAPVDIQATLTELTAQSICKALPESIDEIYLCGGGAYNTYLRERISVLSATQTTTTAELGIAPEWVEAAAFAWLSRQTMNGLSSNSPLSTGASRACILGAVHYK